MRGGGAIRSIIAMGVKPLSPCTRLLSLGLACFVLGCSYPAGALLTDAPGVSKPVSAQGRWEGIARPTADVRIPVANPVAGTCGDERLVFTVDGTRARATLTRADGRRLLFRGSAARGGPLTGVNHAIAYLDTPRRGREWGLVTLVPGERSGEMAGIWYYALPSGACSGRHSLRRSG